MPRITSRSTWPQPSFLRTALEMRYLAQFHTIPSNSSGAAYWSHMNNVTTQAIHDLLRDDEDQFYYYMCWSPDTKAAVKVMIPVP